MRVLSGLVVKIALEASLTRAPFHVGQSHCTARERCITLLAGCVVDMGGEGHLESPATPDTFSLHVACEIAVLALEIAHHARGS